MADPLLYKSLFTLYTGFIVFLGSILNKTMHFVKTLDNYFVLFMFGGLIISITGVVMMFVSHFKTRQPYYEGEDEDEHFAPSLAVGSIFILTGLTTIFYVDTSYLAYVISIAISIFGILISIKGLQQFIKVPFKKAIKKKSLQHS